MFGLARNWSSAGGRDGEERSSREKGQALLPSLPSVRVRWTSYSQERNKKQERDGRTDKFGGNGKLFDSPQYQGCKNSLDSQKVSYHTDSQHPVCTHLTSSVQSMEARSYPFVVVCPSTLPFFSLLSPGRIAQRDGGGIRRWGPPKKELTREDLPFSPWCIRRNCLFLHEDLLALV